ncbi:hypothetical protein PA25_32170 [Pseudoalteromonas sp. A25]|nr:hypothetical protein [Pseudoalteromonas sp. A25]BBN83232.1 hypothetical protein PA25_32170 [Pseudoalteromonas sp. A25]
MLSNLKLKLKTKKVKLLSNSPVLDSKQTKVIAGGVTTGTGTSQDIPEK